MSPIRRSSLIAAVFAFGCGSSDPAPSEDTDDSGSSSGTMASSDSTDGSTTMIETTDTPTTTTGDEGSSSSSSGEVVDETAGESGAADCMVWAITYDLTGSEFELSGTPLGAGDQVNTVMEPYDQDDHVGPGEFLLYFEDVDGAPGGLATMVSYTMVVNFVVDGATTVTTDISGQAGPEECGVTQGLLNGDTIAWAPPQIVDYTTMGTVLCEGALCGAGGLPNGDPVPMDDTTDQPLNSFVFDDDLGGFTMDEIITDMDSTSTQSWMYIGTEVDRELIAAPACACQ